MPYTNKVILGDDVLIDLTSDTVSADNMLQGTTAHDASGRSITGAVVVAPIDKEMSSSSKNPVENNVINAAIEKSLSDAKKYSDDKVSNLVGSAPETLDTLEEISRALKDNNQIVDVLNEAISIKVSKEDGKGLSSNDYTNAEKEKLKGIEAGANKTVVDGVLSNTSKNPVQNKIITQALNKKGTYSKPTGGIPKTDLASEVQTSLGKADTALQEHQDISSKADKAEVTALYNSISDAWNSATAYTVGQYCIHNNALWKCLVANTNTEPIEGTHWTKVSVANEIASVNSSLSTLTWTTASSGLKWAKLPNGLIIAYGTVNISSGSTSTSYVGNGYYGIGGINITDIPFKTFANAFGDIQGLSYAQNLFARFSVTWDQKILQWYILTDNANSAWDCRVVIIGL